MGKSLWIPHNRTPTAPVRYIPRSGCAPAFHHFLPKLPDSRTTVYKLSRTFCRYRNSRRWSPYCRRRDSCRPIAYHRHSVPASRVANLLFWYMMTSPSDMLRNLLIAAIQLGMIDAAIGSIRVRRKGAKICAVFLSPILCAKRHLISCSPSMQSETS